MKFSWVEIDEFSGLAIRIYKNRKLAYESSVPAERIKCVEKALAASQIRRQVFERQQYVCAQCPRIFTWSGGQLHEKQHRGEFVDGRSGEMSTTNSEGLCRDCHAAEHADRAPKFTKRTEWEPITR